MLKHLKRLLPKPSSPPAKTSSAQKFEKKTTETPCFPDAKHTWIGPPHPVSNLRPVVFPVSSSQTPAEKKYYKVHKEVQDWNQQYWEEHNAAFTKARALYIEEHKVRNEVKGTGGTAPSGEEMSHFYKAFLDENHGKHVNYNWEWYKKNFYLLWLAANANISKASRYFSKVWSSWR